MAYWSSYQSEFHNDLVQATHQPYLTSMYHLISSNSFQTRLENVFNHTLPVYTDRNMDRYLS